MAGILNSWLGKRIKPAKPRNRRTKLGLMGLEERTVPTVADFTAVAGGAGSGIVQINSTSTHPTVKYQFYPYGVGFGADITLAVGDVNGDGTPDVITAPGPGAVSNVRVYDGSTFQQFQGTIGSFYAFSTSYTGGVNIAVADVNGDGRDDIIVGQEHGGEVKVFDGATGSLLYDFFPYGKAWEGGVRVAAADVNGDGIPDIITGAGPGAGPHVKVFSISTGTPTEIYSFYAFNAGFQGGVYVAAGDFNSDTNADIVVGAGPGAGPNVRVFSGANPLLSPIANFNAYNSAFRGGVRVAIGNIPSYGNGIITTNGTGALPDTEYFDATSFTERAGFYGAPNGNGGFVAATGPTTSATLTTGVENLYAFQSPDNANNTTLTLTASPFVGGGTSAVFDPNTTYLIHITNTNVTSPTDDILFKITASPPNAFGIQTVTLSEIVGTTVTVLATTTPDSVATLSGLSGHFFAGDADDPSFYDQTGIEDWISSGGSDPMPRTAPVNFYGPDVNDLAMVIEIPTTALIQAGTSGNPDIALWGSSVDFGVQTSRVGEGRLIPQMLLPASDLNLYESSTPDEDRANFLNDALNVLQNAPYNLTASQASAVADDLLPDVLVFNTATPFTTNSTDANGFPNGRRLRDDTASYLLNLMTNGLVTTDGVAEDNGARITDGTASGSTTFYPIQFPYVGFPANSPAQAPNYS